MLVLKPAEELESIVELSKEVDDGSAELNSEELVSMLEIEDIVEEAAADELSDDKSEVLLAAAEEDELLS